MSDLLSGLKRLLMGGAMDQLPEEPMPGEDFGLSGANIQGSDVYDQIRNADRKEAMMPMGPKKIPWGEQRVGWTKSMTPSMSGKGVVQEGTDAAAEARMANGLRAEEAALQRSKIYNPKPLSDAEVAAWEQRTAGDSALLRNPNYQRRAEERALKTAMTRGEQQSSIDAAERLRTIPWAEREAELKRLSSIVQDLKMRFQDVPPELEAKLAELARQQVTR